MIKSIFKISILFIIFFNIDKINAQETDTLRIDFDDIWIIALNNNTDLQSSDLDIQIAEKTKKQSFELPKTEFYLGRGYVNTPDLIDNAYTVNQNFGPIVRYFANSSLYNSELEKAEFEKIMVLKSVKYTVEMAYNTWFFSVLRKNILTEQTKYLKDLAKSSLKRYKIGDIHSMENNINQMNFLRVQNDLIKVNNNYLEADLELRKLILIRDARLLWPLKDIESIKYPAINKELVLDSLFLKIINKSIEVENSKISIAQSEYYPELSISYTNQQLEHLNGNQSFSIGVAVPLWFVTNKAEVQKAKINLEKEKLSALNRRFQLNNELKNIEKRYLNYSKLLDQLSQNTYHEAQDFRKQLYITYLSGEMSGYQFSQSLDIYFNILTSYLDIVEKYNAEIIRLKYFINDDI